MVVSEESLESHVVTGVAYDKSEAKVQVKALPDRPGIVAQLFSMLAEHNISVDIIIQNSSHLGEGRTDVSFTLPKNDLPRIREALEAHVKSIGGDGVEYDTNIVKVSIVGLAMRSYAGVAAKMFSLLAQEGINISAISTSEIKVSCIIDQKYTELAVRTLHDGFGLNKAPSNSVPPIS
jgi:aspartate kinase